MPLEIVRNDITRMGTDAIVNAANTELRMGGGVCGAIFRAAGEKDLQEACDKIGYCEVGKAVLTEGFQLPAKYIIHTPGPIWRGGNQNEAKILESSYRNSLELAKKQNCESIAFPLISTGIYGYPKEEAIQIAISTIHSFLMDNEMNVYLVVFDKKSFGISSKLFDSINEYIDEHYVDELDLEFGRNRREQELDFDAHPIIQSHDIWEEAEVLPNKRSLEDLLIQLDETFSERVLRLIDQKGMTDVEAYKNANLDRKLFSKIRSNPNYKPSKKTAIALAIGLRLNLDETLDLLSTAGYTLSRSSRFDIIIEYFILNGYKNIYDINLALADFEQETLGA